VSYGKDYENRGSHKVFKCNRNKRVKRFKQNNSCLSMVSVPTVPTVPPISIPCQQLGLDKYNESRDGIERGGTIGTVGTAKTEKECAPISF
jgi:hypothetical protein